MLCSDAFGGSGGFGGHGLSVLAFAGSAIQLVPDGTLLFHLGLIVAMVGLLNRTLLKPMNCVLEERERRTRGRFVEAQRVLASIDDKIGGYERRLREARASGYALLEKQRSAASQEREQKVSAVKAEATRWRDEEKEALIGQGAEARASLVKDARVRAAEISARILGREIGRREH